jgi:hypothetical protein
MSKKNKNRKNKNRTAARQYTRNVATPRPRQLTEAEVDHFAGLDYYEAITGAYRAAFGREMTCTWCGTEDLGDFSLQRSGPDGEPDPDGEHITILCGDCTDLYREGEYGHSYECEHGHVSVDAAAADAYVGRLAAERLAGDPGALARLAADPAAFYASLGPELAGEVRQLGGTERLVLLGVARLRWYDLDPGDQRLVFLALVDAVIISPHGDVLADQIEVRWRESAA